MNVLIRGRKCASRLKLKICSKMNAEPLTVDVFEGMRTLFDVDFQTTATSVSGPSCSYSTSLTQSRTTVTTKEKRSARKSKGKKRKKENEPVEVLEEEVEVKKVFRPNYFLAVQINDEEV
jgi:hypothetical protein